MADKESKTVVTYDVDGALDNLRKLDKKVAESGKKAEDAFEKGEKSSSRFESALGGIIDGATSGADGLVSMAFGFNQIAETGAKAVKLIYGITDAIGVQSFGFETALNNIEDYIEKIDTLRKFESAGASNQEALINAQVQRDIRNVRAATVPARQEQAEVTAERRTLEARLGAQKQYYNQLDKLAKESAKARQKAEEETKDLEARIQDRRFDRGISGGSQGFQIQQLLERAQQLAEKGEFDRAEGFLDNALDAAGTNTGAINQVEEAFNRLLEVKKKADTQLATTAGADAARAQAQKDVVAGIQAEVAALREREAILSAQIKNARTEGTKIKALGDEDKLRVKETEAVKALDAAFAKVGETLQGNRGEAELLRDALLALTTGDILIPEAAFNQQNQAVFDTGRFADQINKEAQAAIQGGEDPAAVFERLAPKITLFSQSVSELKGIPNLADQLLPDVQRLEKLRELLLEAKKAAGEVSAAATNLEGATATGLFRAPAQPVVQPPAGDPQANQGARTTQQTVNVNASIKGGLIDEGTVRQLTAIIQREVRRGLASVQQGNA